MSLSSRTVNFPFLKDYERIEKTGERLTFRGHVEDCKFLYHNSWRVKSVIG